MRFFLPFLPTSSPVLWILPLTPIFCTRVLFVTGFLQTADTRELARINPEQFILFLDNQVKGVVFEPSHPTHARTQHSPHKIFFRSMAMDPTLSPLLSLCLSVCLSVCSSLLYPYLFFPILLRPRRFVERIAGSLRGAGEKGKAETHPRGPEES